MSGSKVNSVKTNWEATEVRPVGTIPRRSNSIFEGSEGETEHDMFKVVKGYFLFLSFH